jgi:hypothetical protein
MLPTNKPIIDRTLLGLMLISAWALPTIFTYVFLTPNDMSWWWNGFGLFCAFLMYVAAFGLTFAIGGLRFVLTGREDRDTN